MVFSLFIYLFIYVIYIYIIIVIQEKNYNVFMCVSHQSTLTHLVYNYYFIELYIKVYKYICLIIKFTPL
jgi:hypothetical protein